MTVCKACLAEIIWATDLITGKPRPLDPTPLEDDSGKIAAREIIPGGPHECYSISQPRPLREGFRTYTAHHATCPNWSRRQPAASRSQEGLF
jgi:hypothetical protein